ncbi:MAG: DNA polymerase III subunit epsilon [Pseudomonadota bacterium]
MREIIFDTETTGLHAAEDRIIEIGAVELENRFITGRTYHVFLNPGDRKVHPDAYAVHGISNDDLRDKPSFKEVIQSWFDFTAGADLIAHNSNFDIGFMNAEFDRLGFPNVDPNRVIDSLALARRKHPMGPNSLDALCKRYGIDNSKRTKHGALLDSELLAEVYIELLGGKQASLGLDAQPSSVVGEAITQHNGSVHPQKVAQRPQPLPTRLTADDVAAHTTLVDGLGDDAIWKKRMPG